MTVFQTITRGPFLVLIRLYQNILSPDHSFWAKSIYPNGYCRFNPTCSQYGYEAIQKYGVFKGWGKTLYRIVRCNPWNQGGNDPA
jgi:putative membrane protein insertion efficiency factor